MTTKQLKKKSSILVKILLNNHKINLSFEASKTLIQMLTNYLKQ